MQKMQSLDLDYSFNLADEMIPGKGEDSFFMDYTENAAVAAVFDGCGGIGSRQYASFRGYTGAYMSARAISGALHDWFHDRFHVRSCTAAAGIKEVPGDCRSEQGGDVEGMVREIGERFVSAVGVLSGMADSQSKISGALVRDFPSTAAIALVRRVRQGREIDCIWAGDSRIYLLDEEGLAQLTRDDIAGLDAMENLRKDGALTNMVAADGRFFLNHRTYYSNRPTAVIAATDGCFGYIPTPMDFEYLLLRSLLDARTPMEFEANLKQRILEVAGDDYTLGFMCFGFDTFSELQKSLESRCREVEEKYIRPMRLEGTEEAAQSLWRDYRENYMRCL